MVRKIESGAIGTAHALDPAVGGEKLGVPAVAGVVSHLIVHVLTEANLGRISSNLRVDQIDEMVYLWKDTLFSTGAQLKSQSRPPTNIFSPIQRMGQTKRLASLPTK